MEKLRTVHFTREFVDNVEQIIRDRSGFLILYPND